MAISMGFYNAAIIQEFCRIQAVLFDSNNPHSLYKPKFCSLVQALDIQADFMWLLYSRVYWHGFIQLRVKYNVKCLF